MKHPLDCWPAPLDPSATSKDESLVKSRDHPGHMLVAVGRSWRGFVQGIQQNAKPENAEVCVELSPAKWQVAVDKVVEALVSALDLVIEAFEKIILRGGRGVVEGS